VDPSTSARGPRSTAPNLAIPQKRPGPDATSAERITGRTKQAPARLLRWVLGLKRWWKRRRAWSGSEAASRRRTRGMCTPETQAHPVPSCDPTSAEECGTWAGTHRTAFFVAWRTRTACRGSSGLGSSAPDQMPAQATAMSATQVHFSEMHPKHPVCPITRPTVKSNDRLGV
jgi:hypothetical protein